MAEDVAEATESLPKEAGLVGLEPATSGWVLKQSTN